MEKKDLKKNIELEQVSGGSNMDYDYNPRTGLYTVEVNGKKQLLGQTEFENVMSLKRRGKI